MVPNTLLLALIEMVEQEGFEFREDVKRGLQLSTVRLMERMQTHMRDRVLVRMEKIVPMLLRELTVDTARQGMQAAALFVLKLVDSGLFYDPRESAVLVSLYIKNEADLDDEYWGVHREAIESSARRIAFRCRFEGLYLTPTRP